jgi:hypothetical protein
VIPISNAIFVPFRNGNLGAYTTMVDLNTDTIKGVFVDHGTDVPNVTTDDFLDDIANGARVPTNQTGPTIGTPTIGTVAAGVFDAVDLVFTSLTGASVESLILYKATGTDSTSPLVAYWDTATGLPLTPNGANVTVVWAAGGIITN